MRQTGVERRNVTIHQNLIQDLENMANEKHIAAADDELLYLYKISENARRTTPEDVILTNCTKVRNITHLPNKAVGM